MRILVFSWRDLNHPLAGGAEVYTDAVATEWVKMGHSVTLFCSDVKGCPSREYANGGYEIVRRGSRRSVYSAAKKFWAIHGKGNYDLVIDQVNTRPFFCVNFVRKIPVIVLVHQVAKEVWSYEASPLMSLVGRYILEPWWLWRLRKGNVVTVSNSSRRSLEHYHVKNVTVVSEGYKPVPRVAARREKAPTLVFLGRLAPNKRPGDAIRAYGIVKASIPDAKLWILGDGPERDKLEASMPEGVEFLGRVSEACKLELLARAHVLIATSVREGWGMVVSEAALMGTPTIGYAVEGLVDSIAAHGGICVSSNPDALAVAIIKFFSGEIKIEVSDGIEEKAIIPWRHVALSLLQASE